MLHLYGYISIAVSDYIFETELQFVWFSVRINWSVLFGQMARTQKNKATAHHLGLLKAKMAKLRRELICPKGGGGGGPGEGA